MAQLQQPHEDERARSLVHNQEIIEDEKQKLAELLWQQTDTLLAMGQITEEQALAMKAALMDSYGIILDESQLATQHMLTMMQEWAMGGATSAQEIVGFLNNIGVQTDSLVQQETERITQSIEQWQQLGTGVGDEAANVGTATGEMEGGMKSLQGYMARMSLKGVAEMNKVGTATQQSATTMGEAIVTFGQTTEMTTRNVEYAMQNMAYGIGSSVNTAIGYIWDLQAAIQALPSQKTITITVIKVVPPEFDLESPHFRFQTGLENLVEYARQHAVQIDIGSQGAGLGEVAAGAAAAPAVGGTSNRFSVDQNYRFQGVLSQAEQQRYRDMARQEAMSAFNAVAGDL